ncbi:MAG TPA: hypothetical protein VFJ23_00705 [Candidatus Nitrosotalea sp.]|nr:hypothetical protein [Candidatus Nitrosotalea sp.]
MNKKFAALLLIGIIASGLIYTHPAYAHNFGGDESASWLSKVSEIKTEVANVAKHVGQKDVIDYYADALGEYWNSNDTKEMGEKNALLAQEIPSAINATLADARSGNQNMVNDDVTKLGGYLDESVPVRVDQSKLDNSTVQALAVTFVIKEALEKYADALNSTVDLNDMSQMGSMSGMSDNNMSGSGMSSGSMSNMAMGTIVNANAYENSVALATAAQQMFSDVASKNPNISSNSKISDGFTKLIQDLNGKADANTIMNDVHVGIHPPLIAAYNLQTVPEPAVPEFPLPIVLIIISIAGVVAATRFKSHLGF